jgi:hypothetical protein
MLFDDTVALRSSIGLFRSTHPVRGRVKEGRGGGWLMDGGNGSLTCLAAVFGCIAGLMLQPWMRIATGCSASWAEAAPCCVCVRACACVCVCVCVYVCVSAGGVDHRSAEDLVVQRGLRRHVQPTGVAGE